MSDPYNPYDQLAAYYDLAHQGFVEDFELYESLVLRASGDVLELGVGTGRVALALARQGYRVIGLEPSAAMLMIARRRRDEAGLTALSLVRGEMSAPPLKGQFGLIICARDTFLHLPNAESQIAALTAMRSLLLPSGTVVLDLPGPAGDLADWEPGARAPVLDWSRSLGEKRINRFVSFNADLSSQSHDITEIYEEIAPDGAVRRQVVEYSLRFVFPRELLLLLGVAGLRAVARVGSYDRAAFDYSSERMIVLAQPVGV